MVTLTDFVQEQKELVDRFMEEWLEQRKSNPKDWPFELPSKAEWQEQFIAFISDK